MKLGACIIKLITAVINSVTYKASVFVKASKKWQTIAKALAYCTMGLIRLLKVLWYRSLGRVSISRSCRVYAKHSWYYWAKLPSFKLITQCEQLLGYRLLDIVLLAKSIRLGCNWCHNDIHSSLSQYRINYDCKTFCNAATALGNTHPPYLSSKFRRSQINLFLIMWLINKT